METLKQSIHFIIEHIDKSLSIADEKSIADAIDVIRSAPRLYVYGVGRSGLPAKAFAMRLKHLGLKVYVLGETISPAFGTSDAVILISGSGETPSVVKTARTVFKLKAKIISITGNPNSTLARLSDIVIALQIPHQSDEELKEFQERKKRLAPLGTIFEDSCHIFLDGIVSYLMEKMGQNEESMKYRHATIE
ncbi:MAG: 6-phospho-3-hexuloisomerase [Thermoplasmata archaeon]